MVAGRNGVLPEPMRTLVQHELDKCTSPFRCQSGPAYQAHSSDWCFRQHAIPSSLPNGRPLILVLIDARCASDGEFLACLLAAQGCCVLAGANSAGVAQFAQPGRLVLPHTRLAFRMATAVADIYGDNRRFDGRGLNADLLIPDGFPLDRPSLLNLVCSVRKMISGHDE
jgi:C-terminal processing protease CtpA/Prc